MRKVDLVWWAFDWECSWFPVYWCWFDKYDGRGGQFWLCGAKPSDPDVHEKFNEVKAKRDHVFQIIGISNFRRPALLMWLDLLGTGKLACKLDWEWLQFLPTRRRWKKIKKINLRSMYFNQMGRKTRRTSTNSWRRRRSILRTVWLEVMVGSSLRGCAALTHA